MTDSQVGAATGSLEARAAEPGAVTGHVRIWLRLEGLAVAIGAIGSYHYWGLSWWVFVAFALAPDLSFLAYLAGSRAGAAVYNLAHTYVAPAALLAAGAMLDLHLAVAAALAWMAHIGVDRALGYGLKYPHAFAATHLGRIGRPQPHERD